MVRLSGEDRPMLMDVIMPEDADTVPMSARAVADALVSMLAHRPGMPAADLVIRAYMLSHGMDLDSEDARETAIEAIAERMYEVQSI